MGSRLTADRGVRQVAFLRTHFKASLRIFRINDLEGPNGSLEVGPNHQDR